MPARDPGDAECSASSQGKRGQQEREELQKGPPPEASVVTGQAGPRDPEKAQIRGLQAALKIPSASLT